MYEKDISFTAFGIEFIAHVTYEQEDNKVSIGEVTDVWVEGEDLANHLIKCDKERFLKDFEGELYRALEEAVASDKAAYYEDLYDSQKEMDKGTEIML